MQNHNSVCQKNSKFAIIIEINFPLVTMEIRDYALPPNFDS